MGKETLLVARAEAILAENFREIQNKRKKNIVYPFVILCDDKTLSSIRIHQNLAVII